MDRPKSDDLHELIARFCAALDALVRVAMPAVAIKGVSDLADSKKDRSRGADATYARKFAAFASIATARALLEQGVVP